MVFVLGSLNVLLKLEMNFVVIKFVDKVLNQCRSKLIREKKRAVARLEKLASEFKNKKKALIELNISIEERRQQLLADQIDLKKIWTRCL